MKNVVIAGAVRTAGGKFGGALTGIGAPELGALVVKEAVNRANIDPGVVNELVFGCGWQAGIGPNVARVASVKGGLPVTTSAYTVNMRCGSSLKTVSLGAMSISNGDADVIVAGGTESASNVPYVIPGARWGYRMGDQKAYDVLHKDGFMCPLAEMLMGNTGELLAEKYQISREEQDAFAVESHQKASSAIVTGKFKNEILPIEVKAGKSTVLFDTDENPRDDVDLAKMAKLPPVFQKDGTVTAGNSSALCDGAAAMVLASEEKAKELGMKPMALIRAYSTVGVDPKYMGLSPVDATKQALAKAKMTMKDIDLIELNEAFAVQYLAVEREMGWNREIVNVHGGAIALGHPVGATGSKILTTMLYALQTYDKQIGLVSLCIGGGQGVAMIVERIG